MKKMKVHEFARRNDTKYKGRQSRVAVRYGVVATRCCTSHVNAIRCIVRACVSKEQYFILYMYICVYVSIYICIYVYIDT